MLWVAVARKDDDLVAALLESNCSIDDEPFCSAYAEIGMKKDNRLLSRVFRHGELRLPMPSCTAEILCIPKLTSWTLMP